MTIAQSTPATRKSSSTVKVARALEQEAGELDTIHRGLVRHMRTWREAHDAAAARLTALMARTHALIERLEARRSK